MIRRLLTEIVLFSWPGSCFAVFTHPQGKSTIIKQLTFIHKQVLTKEERLSYIRVLQSNAIQCITTLIKESETFGLPLSTEEQQSADFICNHDQRMNMPVDMANDIEFLWSTEAIKATWARRAEFWHLEATEYYFASVRRFVEPNFLPSDEDIVMARKRTTGVVVTEIDYGQSFARPRNRQEI